MNGKIVAGAIVATALIAGAAIYYLQVYAFYRPIEAGSALAAIEVAHVDTGAPESLATRDFTGIDADSSPLRYRSCFVTPTTLATMTETYQPYDKPTPLNAPTWFTCFDAARIGADLDSGAAVAFLSHKNIRPSVDRVIAVYPDGRAYGWQQLNESADQ